jgi:hypothetical protein
MYVDEYDLAMGSLRLTSRPLRINPYKPEMMVAPTKLPISLSMAGKWSTPPCHEQAPCLPIEGDGQPSEHVAGPPTKLSPIMHAKNDATQIPLCIRGALIVTP